MTIDLSTVLGFIRSPKGKIAASVVAIAALIIAVFVAWPHPKPAPAPITPPAVVQDVQEAARHQGAAEVLEEQADAVGTRADEIETTILQAKPRPKAKPLEDETDEAISRDMADLLGRLPR
jgi:hypothetical protein